MGRHSRDRHDAFLDHPVDFLGDALCHGAGVIAQLRDSLGGIKFVVAHKVIHGKARHALRFAGYLLGHIAHPAEQPADTRGQDGLDRGQACVFREDIEDLLHPDHIAAQNVALARAPVPAGADDGLGHVAVVGAVKRTLNSGGHFSLGVLADNAGHIAEGSV